MNKHDIGVRGEELALKHLLDKGYTLLHHNWMCRAGEIDLVTRIQERLVFVEVKACSGRSLEYAIMNMTRRKITRLTTAIHYYLHTHSLSEENWQVDFVAVAIPSSGTPIIEHWEDTLDW